jgi:nucleoside phosphorylase
LQPDSSKHKFSEFVRQNIAANYAMIAVTFALPAESSDFLRHLRNHSRTDRSGIRTIRGTIDDRAVEVLHTGVGEKVCRQRVAEFLQDQQFDFLISTGFAGALNDQLKVGDLLLAKNFSTIELNNRRSSFSSLPIHEADLLTVSALIDSSEKRLEIARASGAAAVDMETEFIARACADHGIPLLSLRVITDTPREPFPAPPNALFDIEQQQTRFLTFATFFLAHPNRVPRLVQFAKRIARAKKTLANALVQIVREL